MEKPQPKPVGPTRSQKLALYLLSAIMFGIGLYALLQAILQLGK